MLEGDHPPSEAEARAAIGSSDSSSPTAPKEIQPPPSISGMARNAAGDVMDTLGGLPDAVARIIAHPVDSVTAIPAGMLHRIVGLVKDPIQTIYDHPVNTALDVAG